MKFSTYIIPVFFLFIYLFSLYKKINAYEAFVKGVKGGLKTCLGIFPTMFLMYITINMLDRSGAIDFLFRGFNISSEFISQALFRPFSSQASLGFMLEVYKKYGVDSPLGLTSSVLQGSSDSSIYIMSLYLTAYNIKNTKSCFITGIVINLLSFLFSILFYIIILNY